MHHCRIALLLASLGLTYRGGRSTYLVMTVAVAVAAWMALAAMASPFMSTKHQAGSDSIIVRNARGPSDVLPLKYAARLRSIPGVHGVVYSDLQVLLCADGETVTVNAYGGNGAMDALAADRFSTMALRKWQNDPAGLLINKTAGSKCNWKNDHGIQPPDVAGRPVPFNIRGIRPAQPGEGLIAFAHYAYINHKHSLLGKENRVLDFSIQADHPGMNEVIASRIEAQFAYDDPPVVAYPDTARENARARFGKVQYLLGLVMGAIFLCCLLVLASVLAYAARERRSQLGMLRVLGVPRRLMAAGYVLEVLGILIMGTAIGLLLGSLILQHLPEWLGGRFGRVEPAPWAYWLLPTWLSILAAATLIRPCLAAFSAHPVDCRED